VNELEKILKDRNLLSTIKKVDGKFLFSTSNKKFTITQFKAQVFKVFNIVVELQELELFLNKWAKQNKITEKDIRDKLAKQLNGEVEVRTDAGLIDVLTEDEVIEVKEASKWKSAIGQVIAYGYFFTDKTKRIHLFGDINKGNFDAALKICKENNIKMTYESI
jgi:hypothetical protein